MSGSALSLFKHRTRVALLRAPGRTAHGCAMAKEVGKGSQAGALHEIHDFAHSLNNLPKIILGISMAEETWRSNGQRPRSGLRPSTVTTLSHELLRFRHWRVHSDLYLIVSSALADLCSVPVLPERRDRPPDADNGGGALLGGAEEEDLAVYTWGEDDYDGLGDALDEEGDDLNDDTFGAGPIGPSPFSLLSLPRAHDRASLSLSPGTRTGP